MHFGWAPFKYNKKPNFSKPPIVFTNKFPWIYDTACLNVVIKKMKVRDFYRFCRKHCALDLLIHFSFSKTPVMPTVYVLILCFSLLVDISRGKYLCYFILNLQWSSSVLSAPCCGVSFVSQRQRPPNYINAMNNFQPRAVNDLDASASSPALATAEFNFQRQHSNPEAQQTFLADFSGPAESPYEFGPDNVSLGRLPVCEPLNAAQVFARGSSSITSERSSSRILKHPPHALQLRHLVANARSNLTARPIGKCVLFSFAAGFILFLMSNSDL